MGVEEIIFQSKLEKDDVLDCSEWDEEYYKTWRQTVDGNKYHIFLLEKRNIPLTFFTEINDQYFEFEHKGVGEYSTIINEDITLIYLSKPFINTKDKPILSILEDLQKELKIKERHLLKLNKIYIESVEKRNKALDNANISDEQIDMISKNKDKFKEFIKLTSSNQEIGKYTFNRDLSDREKSLLDKMLGKLNPKDVERLLENYKELLEKLDEEKDNEEDAQINSLVGFIGEMVFKHYLERTYQNYDYTADFQPAYDFDVNKKLIDVKTTRKPVKGNSETVPFYIKQSQYRYLMEHKPENYYITRISLNDLGLMGLYNEYKSKVDVNKLSELIKKELELKVENILENAISIDDLKRNLMTFKLNHDDYISE